MLDPRGTMSSDENYKESGDLEDVWRNTSRWRPIQLEILRVMFMDGNYEDILGPGQNLSEIRVDQRLDRILIPSVQSIGFGVNIDELPEDQIPFFNRLIQLSIFTDEPPVDAVTYDILSCVGFETRTIHFRMKPHLEIEWRGRRISSEADYGIFRGTLDNASMAEYLLVVDDKPERRSSYMNGECQLFGEMLLAAMNNFAMVKRSYSIFGMVVRGPTIRFYHSVFSVDYMIKIASDKHQTTEVIVSRFPPQTSTALDIRQLDQRLTVIKMLLSIKSTLSMD